MQKTTNFHSLSSVLKHFKAAQVIKISTLEDAFLCSESTAYGMLRGEVDERIADLRHALENLPEEVSDAISRLIVPDRDPCTDFNGDGRDDKQDVAAGMLLVTKRVVDAMDRQQKSEGNTFGSEEAAQINADLDQIIHAACGLKHLVGALTVAKK